MKHVLAAHIAGLDGQHVLGQQTLDIGLGGALDGGLHEVGGVVLDHLVIVGHDHEAAVAAHLDRVVLGRQAVLLKGGSERAGVDFLVRIRLAQGADVVIDHVDLLVGRAFPEHLADAFLGAVGDVGQVLGGDGEQALVAVLLIGGDVVLLAVHLAIVQNPAGQLGHGVRNLGHQVVQRDEGALAEFVGDVRERAEGGNDVHLLLGGHGQHQLLLILVAQGGHQGDGDVLHTGDLREQLVDAVVDQQGVALHAVAGIPVHQVDLLAAFGRCHAGKRQREQQGQNQGNQFLHGDTSFIFSGGRTRGRSK